MAKINPDELNLSDRVIYVNRVAKVVKGGRRFSFTAIVAVGDGNGYVGIGFGKANEVPDAIRKGIEQAKKSLIKVSLNNGTLYHQITGHYGAAKVLLKPASPGTGVIAGGPVRAILECAGVKNVLTKSLGTSNPHNVVKATLKGLQQIRVPEELAQMRGKSLDEMGFRVAASQAN